MQDHNKCNLPKSLSNRWHPRYQGMKVLLSKEADRTISLSHLHMSVSVLVHFEHFEAKLSQANTFHRGPNCEVANRMSMLCTY